MSNWNFDKPDETSPGEHVFALVVYTESKDIGVRSMERAQVSSSWGNHVFAWMAIDFPLFSIKDAKRLIKARDQK